MDLRIGNGLDFHRLKTDPSRPLLLGGYEIASELALEGHSDADVVLHALADALLGAIGQGDIGQHFPDSDESLKNLDSRKIVNFALGLVREHGFRIANIDLTLVGEKPRVAVHRDAIRASLAGILGLDVTRIGFKATTTEKMGALGRSEGVACLATVLLVSLTPAE
ncbi:MAG: 2-C-methyl-D-erythritol 2,4-cyclodiphosphate synthase [Spirochaetales bacterium]|nr:2-C-methyl-D-erythritol 2,4-cyclodiphosphate synthase [Leptospiraceae bacterium]MCP5483364.1 2-C-methyl-D-erythritol 2,4-cyclodiphosphate synthase [Spirochaetales bacterium]MCP5484153.1 2-C-methyl-D-erythritol 2,4-cyclodiphosphate synthase [Spirochaetales bacterium]